jgi:type I restriction enzyme S subunit
VNDDGLRQINNRSNLEVGDVLFSGTGTIGRTAMVSSEPNNWNVKEGVYIIKPKRDLIDSMYLLFYLNTTQAIADYTSRIVGASVNSVPMAELKKITIPIPNIKRQREIANTIENFHKLAHDIREGLPAELNARRKQHEYYRSKLLTFEELKV